MYSNDLNITFSTSKDLAKDFAPNECRFSDFAEILKSEINYSPFQYSENYRKETNSLISHANALIFDFDDGTSIDMAKDIFVDFSYIIATTRSHQKEKNGKVCDRFRLVLPCETNFQVSIQEYKDLMRELIERYGADPACKDVSRFYFGFKDSQIQFNFGRLFDIQDEIQKLNKKKQIRAEMLAKKEVKKVEFEGHKIDTLREISKTPAMLKVLKFYDRFIPGQRNTALFSMAKYLQESGMTDDEVISETLWLNTQGQSMDEIEIQNTIFKSLGIREN